MFLYSYLYTNCLQLQGLRHKEKKFSAYPSYEHIKTPRYLELRSLQNQNRPSILRSATRAANLIRFQ